MDYGQNNKQNDTLDFFTAGVGTNNPEVNSFESENNLDLSNNQVNWQESPIDNQEIGNKVMSASKEQIIPPDVPEIPEGLGQIIDLEPPKQASTAQISAEAIARNPYNKEVIKTGETLNKEGIREMDRIVKEFEKDGNAADFYETARDMTETHLNNSYNRVLGEKTESSVSEASGGKLAA